jgi:hypothetical protein
MAGDNLPSFDKLVGNQSYEKKNIGTIEQIALMKKHF